MDQLTNSALRHTHCRRHLGPAPPVDGGLDECVVLARGQLGHGREDIERQHPLLGHLVRGLGDQIGFAESGHRRRASRLAPGQIPEDPVQPPAEMAHLRPGLKRRQGRQEGLLDEVVGPARVQAPGLRQEGPAIAVRDRLRGARIPLPGQRHQSVVGLRPQQEVRQPRAHTP
jgi:hypothetical protein